MPSLHIATKGICAHAHEDISMGMATKGMIYFIAEGTVFVPYIPYFLTKSLNKRKHRAVSAHVDVKFLGTKKIKISTERPDIIAKRSWLRRK